MVWRAQEGDLVRRMGLGIFCRVSQQDCWAKDVSEPQPIPLMQNRYDVFSGGTEIGECSRKEGLTLLGVR